MDTKVSLYELQLLHGLLGIAQAGTVLLKNPNLSLAERDLILDFVSHALKTSDELITEFEPKSWREKVIAFFQGYGIPLIGKLLGG